MSAPKRIDLARVRWWPVVMLGILTLGAAVAGPMQILRAGGPLAGKLVVVAVLLSTVAYLWAILICALRTYLSEAGVHKPALIGKGETFIAWSEIDRVVLRDSTRLELYSGRKKIAVAVFTFRDRAALGRLIEQRVPVLQRERPSS